MDHLTGSLAVSAGLATEKRQVSAISRPTGGGALRSLAALGSRLALLARRIGQPADTLIAPDVMAPEDIRARYIVGLYGTVDYPPTLRDPNRRW